jgi:sulfopyruvate decarboxylase TPP-binding subunit
LQPDFAFAVLAALRAQFRDLFRNRRSPMKPEKAQLVVDGLKEAGVDFAAGVPDAQFIEVYKMLAADRDIRYVGAANEAEATGIGFGAWFGGKKPALILATSGLLVATYHLARINLLHEVPVLVVIPYRGDIGDPRWLGLYKKTTEPGLNAMDIPYRIVSRPDAIKRTIKDCNESARAWLKPVAVLLNEEALW